MKKVFIFMSIACMVCVACTPKAHPTEVQLNAEAFLPEVQERLNELENELYDFVETYPEVSFTEAEENYVFSKAKMLCFATAKVCAEECGMSELTIGVYDLYAYIQALDVERLKVSLSPEKEELADRIIAVCKYRRAVSLLEAWSMK